MNRNGWIALTGGAAALLVLTLLRRKRHAPVEGAHEMLVRMPAGWWNQPRPKPRPKNCYRRKIDTLNRFADANSHVIEAARGLTYDWTPAEFDNLNNKNELTGNQRVTTMAQALWITSPVERPFCQSDIDIDALNSTSIRAVEDTGGFRLPDYVHEEIAITAEAAEHKRLQEEHDAPKRPKRERAPRRLAPSSDDGSDVPF